MGSSGVLFYVDDDPDDRKLMKDVFTDIASEFSLESFAESTSMFQALKAGKMPCMIILDLNMPGLDGKDTLRLIRNNKEYISIPVTIFTTSSMPNDIYFANHFGASFEVKPLTLEQMRSKVEKFIAACKTLI